MTRRVLPLVALVIITNIVMRASVRANRTGDPDATMTLTERELRVERTSDRDSAQKLRIDARASGVPYWTDRNETGWLTTAKLATLGFTCRLATDRTTATTQSCGLQRRAFVAYEYDGPAWRKIAAALQLQREEALRKASAANSYAASSAESLDNQIKYGSRLVAVDASTDSSALRRAYPDRRRYLVLPATVQAWLTVDQRTNASAAPVVSGTLWPVTTVLIAPPRLRDRLLKFGPSDWMLTRAPRYTIDVAVGRRYEPWILAIDPIDSAAPPH
jgi:hypothetical protein